MLVLCGSVSKNNIDNFWKLDKINQKPTTIIIKKNDKKINNTRYFIKIPVVINKNVKIIKKPLPIYKKFE